MTAESEMEVEEMVEVEPKALEVEKTVEVNTGLTKEQYDLTWRIENFNIVPFIRSHPIYGPFIRLGKKEDSTWQLLLSKERGEYDNRPSLGFKLVKTEENSIWDVCRYDITVKSENGDIQLKVVENQLVSGEEDIPYTYVKGVVDDFHKKEKGDQPNDGQTKKGESGDPETDKILKALFKEEVLVVQCDIRYTYMPCDVEEPYEETPLELFVENLGRLLKSHKYCDVVLVAAKREFPSHKSILCARSIVFDKLFQEADSIEKLHLKEVSPSVADWMLKFIYTGEYPDGISTTDCYGLYKAAIEYSLKGLKDFCFKELLSMAHDELLCDDCDYEETTIQKLMDLELLSCTDEFQASVSGSTLNLVHRKSYGISPRKSSPKPRKIVSKSSPVVTKNRPKLVSPIS